MVKTYAALGMREAGIKLIGPGDITQDTKLQAMGPAAVGLITMHHYHADLDNPENKRFVEAWKKEYGANSTPDFMAVGGYDGMAAIVHVIQTLKGKIDTDKALEALKGWKFNSPRGPIMIDPVTRDIVMNEYLSEAVMKDGRVYQKVIGKIDGGEGRLQGAEDRAVRPQVIAAMADAAARDPRRRRRQHAPGRGGGGHGAVHRVGGALRHHGPDGLRQPRPWRLRHARGLRHRAGHEAVGPRLRAGPGLSASWPPRR